MYETSLYVQRQSIFITALDKIIQADLSLFLERHPCNKKLICIQKAQNRECSQVLMVGYTVCNRLSYTLFDAVLPIYSKFEFEYQIWYWGSWDSSTSDTLTISSKK